MIVVHFATENILFSIGLPAGGSMGLKRSFRARCGNLDRDAGLFSVPGTDNGAAEFRLADAERPGSALDISLILITIL